jgi:hypothetical protein
LGYWGEWHESWWEEEDSLSTCFGVSKAVTAEFIFLSVNTRAGINIFKFTFP